MHRGRVRAYTQTHARTTIHVRATINVSTPIWMCDKFLHWQSMYWNWIHWFLLEFNGNIVLIVCDWSSRSTCSIFFSLSSPSKIVNSMHAACQSIPNTVHSAFFFSCHYRHMLTNTDKKTLSHTFTQHSTFHLCWFLFSQPQFNSNHPIYFCNFM